MPPLLGWGYGNASARQFLTDQSHLAVAHTAFYDLPGIPVFLFAGKKDRDWKTGHVLDSSVSQQTYVTGSVTQTSGSATAIGTGAGTATTTGNTTTLNGTTFGTATTP